MTPDQMAEELRSAGWREEWPAAWSAPLPNDLPLPGFWDTEAAWNWMRQQSRETTESRNGAREEA